MISRLLTLVVLLPLAILLVIFCVVNRAPVTLSMDAFGTTPQFALQAPLFVVVVGSLILGVLVGGIGTWFTQSTYRARAARRAREVDSLRHEVAATNQRMQAMREERARTSAAVGIPAPEPRPALGAPRAA